MRIDVQVVLALAAAWVAAKVIFWAGLSLIVKGVLNRVGKV